MAQDAERSLIERVLSSAAFKACTILALIMLLPWILEVPLAQFVLGLLFLSEGALYALPLIIPSALSLVVIGIAVRSSLRGEAHKHPLALMYAHGLFASMTFMYSASFRSWGLFILAPLIERLVGGARFETLGSLLLYAYLLLYPAYALLAYRTLSRLILMASRPSGAQRLWRAAACVALAAGSALLIVLLRDVEAFERLLSWRLPLGLQLALLILILLAVGIDELWLGGGLRHIRYPVLVPLAAYSLWALLFMPPALKIPTPERVGVPLIYGARLVSLIPGVKCVLLTDIIIPQMCQEEVPPDWIILNPLAPLVGLWILLEWLAFGGLLCDLAKPELPWASLKKALLRILARSPRGAAEIAERTSISSSSWAGARPQGRRLRPGRPRVAVAILTLTMVLTTLGLICARHLHERAVHTQVRRTALVIHLLEEAPPAIKGVCDFIMVRGNGSERLRAHIADARISMSEPGGPRAHLWVYPLGNPQRWAELNASTMANTLEFIVVVIDRANKEVRIVARSSRLAIAVSHQGTVYWVECREDRIDTLCAWGYEITFYFRARGHRWARCLHLACL